MPEIDLVGLCHGLLRVLPSIVWTLQDSLQWGRGRVWDGALYTVLQNLNCVTTLLIYLLNRKFICVPHIFQSVMEK